MFRHNSFLPVILNAEQIANFRFGRKSGEVSVASIARKQGDESKRNFTARDENSYRHFVPAGRNFVFQKFVADHRIH